ncbi:MAG: hypothetical protein C4617_02530 [Candidatus Liberibacter europaeus]|uniref:Uncharacterized protein n=1 Tax=Candidatus Liberibacter europaeus TaxID=744859 RepID=A0A2T4VY60_9HYPH|nr:hypothetical protein [Candidatus Liberibacter europaeus]PTL86710.1 MAG: hypothetical protein C4617_02530 [Candidatus Liberibacter europaeus]
MIILRKYFEMKNYSLSILAIILFLSTCVSSCKNQEIVRPKNEGIKNIIFSEKSVWKYDGEILSKCRMHGDIENCIFESIKKTGGTIEALQAAQYLTQNFEPAYVSNYKKEGLIGVLTVEYPLRANENTGTLLIPAIGGPIIDVDKITENCLPSSPVWKSFEKKHPELMYVSGYMLRKEQTDRDMRLIFSYPLRTCRICDDIGSIDITYNFTIKGIFIACSLSDIRYGNL